MNTANCLPGEQRRARGVAVTWTRLGGLSTNWLLHVPQESRGYATSGEQWRYAIVTFTVSPRHSWPPATSLYQAQEATRPSLPLACHLGTYHYVAPGTRDLSCTHLTVWSVSKESSLGVDETFLPDLGGNQMNYEWNKERRRISVLRGVGEYDLKNSSTWSFSI